MHNTELNFYTNPQHKNIRPAAPQKEKNLLMYLWLFTPLACGSGLVYPTNNKYYELRLNLILRIHENIQMGSVKSAMSTH
jgi:hypothetical protein